MKMKEISLILIGIFLIAIIISFNYNIFNLLFFHPTFDEYEIIYPEDNEYDLHNIKMSSGKTTFLMVEIVKDGFIQMVDDSGKYTIDIFQFDKMNDEDYKLYNGKMAYDKIRDYQLVDGIKIYEKPANIGEYAGEDRYYSIIEKDSMIIYISTPEINETVKLANSVELIDKKSLFK